MFFFFFKSVSCESFSWRSCSKGPENFPLQQQSKTRFTNYAERGKAKTSWTPCNTNSPFPELFRINYFMASWIYKCRDGGNDKWRNLNVGVMTAWLNYYMSKVLTIKPASLTGTSMMIQFDWQLAQRTKLWSGFVQLTDLIVSCCFLAT